MITGAKSLRSPHSATCVVHAQRLVSTRSTRRRLLSHRNGPTRGSSRPRRQSTRRIAFGWTN
jgi:hypothetical protein